MKQDRSSYRTRLPLRNSFAGYGSRGLVAFGLVALVVFLGACGIFRRAERPTPTSRVTPPGVQSETPGSTPTVPAVNQPGLSSGVKLMGAGLQPEDLKVGCDALKQYGSRYQWYTTNWQEAEPSKGRWNYNRLDAWVNGYITCGQEVATHVMSNAEWAIQPQPGGPSSPGHHAPDMPPKNDQDYYDFIFNLATHFKGRIATYSIENEAHASQNWGGTPEQYMHLLQLAYKAVKAADPNAMVEDAGLSSGVWGTLVSLDMYRSGATQQASDYLTTYLQHYKIAGATGDVSAEAFIKRMQENPTGTPETLAWFDLLLQNGAYFDRLQVHYYAPWQDLTPLTDYIHKKMGAAGINKPLDFFEMGYGWDGAPKNGYDPEAHARDLAKLLTIVFGEGGDRLVDYRMNCVTDEIGQPGLFDCNQNPRPAAFSFKTTAEKLNGATSGARLSLGNNIWGYEFVKGDKKIYVVWSTTGTTARLPFSGGATVTDINGKATSVNSNSIATSPSPVFVEP